jgi:hypothetical protein
MAFFAWVPLVAANASTEGEGDGILWGKLQAGMTHKEVRSILPRRAIRISTNCIGLLQLHYLHGKLDGVHIISSRRNHVSEACADVVAKTLKKTYGDGTLNNLEFAEGWIGQLGTSPLWPYMHGVNQSKYNVLSWVRNDKIVFFRNRLGTQKWSIDYFVNPKAAPDGRL